MQQHTNDAVGQGRTPRPVFFVSESTGITAEELGHTLLSQFEGVPFDIQYLPFVNSPDKAEEVAQLLQLAFMRTGLRPIVFATLVNHALGERIQAAPCRYFELFDTFLGPLAEELGVAPSGKAGLSHGLREAQAYDLRYDTIHFALNNDDGERMGHFADADVVLIGVSRCGKTPTCLYLALHYGMRAANYPLTDDDFERGDLPPELRRVKDKLVALTLEASRLHRVRQQRRPNSEYASLEKCQRELRAAADIYARWGIEVLDATSHSIEELASHIHKSR